jgi:hypothetical protein
LERKPVFGFGHEGRTEMNDPRTKTDEHTKQHKPRNPGNPTGDHRQELDPKRGSQSEGDDKRDSFSGEKMPKH